jgi:hypothetical protein
MSLTSTLIIAAGLIGITTSAVAQDLPVPDTSGAYADSLLSRRLGDSMMRYQRRHNGGPRPSSAANARATCANKGRAAANFGIDHPKVRQLYALCAQAGY